MGVVLKSGNSRIYTSGISFSITFMDLWKLCCISCCWCNNFKIEGPILVCGLLNIQWLVWLYPPMHHKFRITQIRVMSMIVPTPIIFNAVMSISVVWVIIIYVCISCWTYENYSWIYIIRLQSSLCPSCDHGVMAHHCNGAVFPDLHMYKCLEWQHVPSKFSWKKKKMCNLWEFWVVVTRLLCIWTLWLHVHTWYCTKSNLWGSNNTLCCLTNCVVNIWSGLSYTNFAFIYLYMNCKGYLD